MKMEDGEEKLGRQEQRTRVQVGGDPRDARRNTAPLRLSFVPQNSLGANGKSPGTANNFPNTLTGL